MYKNLFGMVRFVLLCELIVVAGSHRTAHCQDVSLEFAGDPSPAQCQGNSDQCSYGSCDCGPPGTLFQWSYGTSFGGGPNLDEPLVTDRPDFTESSSTVGRGVAQLEFGYTYVFDNDGTSSVRSHSFPETLLRYGILAEWLELRIALNYAEIKTTTGGISTTVNGAEDLYLGFKIALTPQEDILPEMALIPQMTVPSGSAPFNNGQVLPGVNWVYSWEVNELISTAGSSQVKRALDPVTSGTYVEFAQSWTIAYSLCDRIGAYTEWYALFPSGAVTVTPQHFFNGGFSFLLNDDIQFDVRAGVGLNDAADDYSLGTGASIRY